MLPTILLIAFPNLEDDGGEVTAPPDYRYNCIAWAVGVTDDVWWPTGPRNFWPADVLMELTIDAFVAALETMGYSPAADGVLEPGVEKAALYTIGSVPTHAARQLPDGRWSSKLGGDCLISHNTPAGVEGAVYGTVALYLRRPRV